MIECIYEKDTMHRNSQVHYRFRPLLLVRWLWRVERRQWKGGQGMRAFAQYVMSFFIVGIVLMLLSIVGGME